VRRHQRAGSDRREVDRRFAIPSSRPRCHELIELAKSAAKATSVSTSLIRRAPPARPRRADFAAARQTHSRPRRALQPSPGRRLQLARWRGSPAYRCQPIVYNEDDHFEFDKPDNHFVAAVESGASWGYFDYRMSRERFEDGFQSLPVDWTISSKRKRAFFGLLKEITGS
jgi:hypothetical protein